MNCRDTAELIPLHVGDDLPNEEAARLESHLENCALCSAEYASFAGAREALLSLREEMPSRGSLWAGLSMSLTGPASVQTPAAALTGITQPRRGPRWMLWSSLAAAAAVVAFLPSVLDGWDSATDQKSAGGELGPTASREIQATTPEELREFLLRTGGLEVQPRTAATEGDELLPLTTPASARPKRTQSNRDRVQM